MKKNAVALRAITHAEESFAVGDVILGLPVGQFNDWSAPGVEIVREASAAEVARAKGETAPPKAKAKPARKPRAPVTKPAAEAQAPAAEPARPPIADA